ncbi:MAG: phosphatase PAP2 family protein [Alphaproteobacteria bacterium]|nr:phosphatase PAP2 family protein [Alphaproteobacteria bacterium]
MNRMLTAIAGAVVLLDIVWIGSGRFAIDATAYLALALMIPPCMGAAYYYGRFRNEPSLSAMFSAAAFLMTFPAAMCLLSYLALTVAGPRIDVYLLAIDRSLGVSWPAIMAFAADHPWVTVGLNLAYQSIVPQSLLLLVLLGWCQRPLELYGLCLAIAGGAIAAVGFWTMFPSFGAYSMYHLAPAVAAKLHLAEGVDYGHELTQLLKNGPGFISPKDLRGLIGFPSFHTVQAIILAWYARNIPYVRWPSLALNVVVIAATPVHGGHHLIDIAGGCIVAALAITFADSTVRRLRVTKAAERQMLAVLPEQSPLPAA